MSGPGGAWREQPLEWYAEPKDACEVCGRLVPSRRWVFRAADREMQACTPECEQLYFDYVVPLRG